MDIFKLFILWIILALFIIFLLGENNTIIIEYILML